MACCDRTKQLPPRWYFVLESHRQPLSDRSIAGVSISRVTTRGDRRDAASVSCVAKTVLSNQGVTDAPLSSDPYLTPARTRSQRLRRRFTRADETSAVSELEAALRHALAFRHMDSLRRLALHRPHYNPNQPRVPAGKPDGGEWTNSGADAGRAAAADGHIPPISSAARSR